MPAEVWRPVAGYEGVYEVSSLGRVRSLDRVCVGRDGRSELHRGKVLCTNPGRRGYVTVSLRKGGPKTKKAPVHSIVAAAFLGERPSGHDVMHLNGIRTDNRVENLKYGSREENLHQTYDYGGKAGPGKLSIENVHDIRKRLRQGQSPTAIAKVYGVNSAAIYHIKNRTTFKWLPEEVGV